MAEPSTYRSALEAVYEPGSFGAANPGLTIRERRGLSIQSVAALTDYPGGPLSPMVGEVTIIGDARIHAIAPDRWLVIGPSPETLASGLAVNDVGFGRTVLRIEGPAARDVLAKGCPLDLHPAAFGPDRSAQTLLGPFTVLIDCIAPDAFDIFVNRSFGEDFWGWLSRASAEYGYTVESA